MAGGGRASPSTHLAYPARSNRIFSTKKRTGDFAKQSSGSAARILRIPARAGRACRSLQWRDCFKRTGDFAKQSSGSGGAALESIGFDSQQSLFGKAEQRPAAGNLLDFYGALPKPCTAGFSVRYRQSAKSRPANLLVCRLRESSRFQRGLVAPAGRCSGTTASNAPETLRSKVPAAPRESFGFQRGLVAPAGRCSGATASNAPEASQSKPSGI